MIEELLAYKRLGLKTFRDVEIFLNERKNKDEYNRRPNNLASNNLYDPQSHSIKRYNNGSRDNYECKYKNQNKDNKSSLNEQEIKLCNMFKMSLHEYLCVKDMLIKESYEQGLLSRSYTENAFKMDKERVMGVFDFLVSHNIILEK